MTTATRLTCIYCGEPIRKSHDNFDHRFEYTGGQASAIERAWHRACEPLAVPTDSPFNAALQKAKQAIADAKRLGPEAYGEFVAIVTLALMEQRAR